MKFFLITIFYGLIFSQDIDTASILRNAHEAYTYNVQSGMHKCSKISDKFSISCKGYAPIGSFYIEFNKNFDSIYVRSKFDAILTDNSKDMEGFCQREFLKYSLSDWESFQVLWVRILLSISMDVNKFDYVCMTSDQPDRIKQFLINGKVHPAILILLRILGEKSADFNAYLRNFLILQNVNCNPS